MSFSPYYLYRVFAWGVQNHQGAAEKKEEKKNDVYVRTLFSLDFFGRAIS
jgi:hypothetical protein